ncbi:ATP-binding protein [Clostridium butyricum]|uniref:ATP-binding protein n=1 Tax=Clostridium butyricum TaxID=1492 RepID=UPI0034676F51
MYPYFNDDERKLPDHIRIHIISERLFKIFQPLPRHIDLESRISTMIRTGYISRNPLSKEYTESLIQGYMKLNDIEVENINNFCNTANSVSIIGASGMGKSSSLNRVLSNFPQVIGHYQYKDKKICIYQVVWLKIDCPFDGSVKGLCIDFFNRIDQILGTRYFEKYATSKRTVDTLLSILGQVARNSGLGLLIIDEIQHLSQAKSGGVDKMLNFFTTLVNTVGIPVVLVGTMKAKNLLQNDFRMARRTLGTGGNIVWERLKNDESFSLLMDTIWEYQFTKKKTLLTEELINLLYEESQGIIDIAVKIYAMAQIKAISTGKEEITVDIIKEVVDNNLNAVKPMIDAMKSNDIRKIAKYEDISTIDYEDFLSKTNTDTNLSSRIQDYKTAKRKKQLSKKEDALIRLMELDIDRKKAVSAIENILLEDEEIGINKLVVEAIKVVDTIKATRKKTSNLKEDDIRLIIKSAKEEDKSPYLALKEKGYIANADFQGREIV